MQKRRTRKNIPWTQADLAAFMLVAGANLPVRKKSRGDESGFVPRPHQQRAVEAIDW